MNQEIRVEEIGEIPDITWSVLLVKMVSGAALVVIAVTCSFPEFLFTIYLLSRYGTGWYRVLVS